MADDLHVAVDSTTADWTADRLGVSLLGSMQVEFDGRPLHVGGRQRRRLLALLAIRAGRVVPVESLVDAMWGDDPPPSAAKTVQSHVVRLRQSLNDAGDPIETTPGGYRLRIEPQNTDVVRFERLANDGAHELRLRNFAAATELLEAALALWRGPAFVEFAGAEFARGDGARLEERRLTALEDLADARLATGGARTVAADMERIVASEPGRERAWALLMRALYASGRQHDALDAYQRARATLGEQFGLEPGPELRRLEQRVVNQDPSLIPRNPGLLPTPLRHETTLVGRANELAWLRAAFSQARTGVGQVRSVLGPIGSGRTRLVAEMAATVVDEGGAVEYIAGASGLHLLTDGVGPGSVIDAIAARCRTNPLMVVIDDVEWTPPASVDAIRALAAAAEQLSLFFVLVGQDVDGPVIRLIHDLERSCSSTLYLAPMSDHDVADILAREGIDSEAIDAAVAMADGLPGMARREAAAWAERAATDRLNAAAAVSIGARSAATRAGASMLDEVMRLIEARGRRAALSVEEWTGRQPYRSLASYEAADADLFVGRERLVAELTARVLDRRLVAVVGASGSGKSSIVRAGLIPIVRSGRLPGSTAWRASVIVPGDDPLGSIEAVSGLDEAGPQLLVIDQFEEVLPSGRLDEVAGRLLDLVLDPALDVRVAIVVRADQIGALAASRALAELIEDAQVLVGPPSDEELRRIIVEPARRTGCAVDPELVAMITDDVAGYDAALPLVSAALAEVWERRDGDALRATVYEEIGGLAAAVQRLGDRALADIGPAGAPAVREVMLRLVDVTDEGAWIRKRIASADMPEQAQLPIEALLAARLIVHTGDTLDVVHEVVFRAWPQMANWLEEARADITLERDLRAAARSWEADGRSDDDVLRGGRLHAAAEWAARCDHVPALVSDLIAASHEWTERDNRAIREQLVREQRGRRRLRGALVAASLLIVVAVVVGLLALDNGRRADRQRDRADAAATQAAAAADAADAAAADAADAADLAEQRRSDAESARTEADAARTDAETARTEAVAQQRITAQDALVNTAVAVRSDRRDLAALLAIEAHRRSPSSATENALFGLFTEFPGLGSTVDIEGGAVAGPYLKLLPDGEIIAAASATGAVRLIDVATGREVAVLETGAKPPARGWSEFFTATPDSRLLAVSVSRDLKQADGSDAHSANLSVWNVATREPVFAGVEVPTLIGSLALSADGRLLAVAGGEEGRTLILDAASGELLRELEPIPRPDDAQFFTNTVAVRFMSDDRLIVTSQAGPIRIMDPRTGTELQRFESPRETAEASAILAPDESWLLTAGAHGMMRYDLPAGTPAWGAPLDRGCDPTAVANLGLVLCTEVGGRVTTIDLAKGGLAPARFEGTNGAVATGATPDGSTVIVFTDQHYSVWRTNGSGLVNRVLSRSDTPFIVGYTSDGSRLLLDAEADDGPAAEIVDAASGEVVDRIAGASMVHTTSDPGRVVMRFADGTVGWYDLADHRPVGTPVDPGFEPADIIATPDGAVAWGFDERVVALDLTQGRAFDLPSIYRLWGVIASPDGRLYTNTFANHGELQRRDPVTWAEETRADIATGSFLAGSDVVVASTDRGTQYLLDPDTLAVVGTLPDSRGFFTDLALDAQENRLLTIGADNEIRLYDLGTRQQLGVGLEFSRDMPFNNRTQHGLALRPDGRQAAFLVPGGIAIWDLDPDHWVEAACQLASRNLTHEEWDTYVGVDEPYRSTCPEWPAAID